MSKSKIVSIVLTSLVLVTALVIGGYQLGWWIKADSTERQVQIDNQNTGTQIAWHDQAIQGIRDYELVDPSNTAARGALRNQTCELIARLSNPYRDDIIVAFYMEVCK